MHHAIFMAKEIYVRYGVIAFSSEWTFVDRKDEIKGWVKIHECESSSEPYTEKNEIYFKDVNKFFKIEKVSRTPEGGYVYLLDYVIREIVDEETEASRVRAEQRLAETREKYEKLEKLREEVRSKEMIPFDPPTRPWWRRLFG